jgi:ribosomal protein S18 acetylase RimI-like enzyme
MESPADIQERNGVVGGEAAAVRALEVRCRPVEMNLHLGAQAENRQLLAYRRRRLVGVLSLALEERGESTLCVDPSARRKGIGRALLREADKRLARVGIQEMLVECDATSEAGAAFLAALGGTVRHSELRLRLAALRVPDERAARVSLVAVGRAEVGIFAESSAISFGHPVAANIERVKALWESPGQRYYLARVGDEFVGGLRVGFLDDATYIASFHIRPEARGKGFGRDLLLRVCRELRDAGEREIRIETRSDNERALELYRSCGFEIMRRYDYYARRVAS